MLRVVMFDLDGTLLPMNNDDFTKGYFKFLVKKLAPHGYDPEELIAAIWKGTAAMVRNDGSRTNYEAFWETFASILGERVYGDQVLFEEFYANDFNLAKDLCGYREASGKAVKELKEKGLRVVLASNPLFPMPAQLNRIRWAGVDPEDFEVITSYEDSVYCKPNPMYYKALTGQLGVSPEECLMIGNDAQEDMAAAEIGMKVFLMTDDLINKEGRDISVYPNGDLDKAMEYVYALTGDNE